MARILIVTQNMQGAWFSLQIEEEGHTCDVWLHDNYDVFSPALGGIIKTPLKAKPNFKKYDLVICDQTDQCEIAEDIMSQGVPCIGDGDLNTHIENDRMLSIQVMEECGINVPFWEGFDDIGDAKKFVKQTKKRFVFKPDDCEGQNKATTYVSKSYEDMLMYLDKIAHLSKTNKFIMQEVVEGTEVSTEAWFNGTDFFLISGTLEEKKFMEGNKGPNTGCAGNLEIIYDQLNKPLIFREGLEKTKDFLSQYNFRGYIDLNTIVSDSKLYGLEWTPRFGYDCTATLFNLISNVTNFLGSIATGGHDHAEISNIFSSGVRISIPPYPSEIDGEHPEGIPIEGIEENDIIKDIYLYDCGLDKSDSLITVGMYGFICVPLAKGNTVEETWVRNYNRVNSIHIPNMQYRGDLEKYTKERYTLLARQGWLR